MPSERVVAGQPAATAESPVVIISDSESDNEASGDCDSDHNPSDDITNGQEVLQEDEVLDINKVDALLGICLYCLCSDTSRPNARDRGRQKDPENGA